MTKIELYNGDCLDVMKQLPDGSVDMVLTDPPYGMNFQSCRSKDGKRYKKIENDDRVLTEWIPIVYNKLRNGGGLLSFCNWNTSVDWLTAIKKAGFNVKSQVIWDRMHHGMGDLNGTFAPQHDIIWYATKGRRIFVNGRPKSIIRHKRPSPSEDNGHPTCKPVDLCVDLIDAIDDGNTKTILDPFMGSGTTGVACVKTGRNFIGIELDRGYFENAKNRIHNTTPMLKGLGL